MDFQTRFAAYGVLVDERERILLALWNQGPQPRWTMPGGGAELTETPEETMVREVAEEIDVHLDPRDLEPLGDFEAVAANEPDTLVRSSVFVCRRELPEPVAVRAELADHRWVRVDDPGTGPRLAPLMLEHILPALRAL